MQQINCAVVGQSNSILTYGFAAHLSSRVGINVVRFGRVGMSSSLIGPFFVQPGFCKDLNFCIIDLAMFDHSIKDNRGGNYDFTALRKYLRHVIHVCRANGCCPILIAFCPAIFEKNGRWYDPKDDVSEIVELHRNVALEEHCPIFDWTSFVRLRLEKENHLRTRDLYAELPGTPGAIDGSHPRSDVQSKIAEYLHRYMLFYLMQRRTAVDVDIELPLYDSIPLACYGSAKPQVERVSGMLKRTFVRLQEGDPITVPAPDTCHLAGYAININESRRMIRFSGTTTVVKDLNFPEALRTGSFRYHVAPVYQECRPLNGNLVVETIAGGVVTEDGILKMGGSEVPGNFPPALEIEALIVERPSAHMIYRTSHISFEDRDVLSVCHQLTPSVDPV